MNESKQIEVYGKERCDDGTKYLNIVAWQTYMSVKTGILIAELKSRHSSTESEDESGNGTAPQAAVLNEKMPNKFRLGSRVNADTFTGKINRNPRDLWKQGNTYDMWVKKPRDEWEVSSAEYMLKVELDRDKFTYTGYCTFLYIHNWLPGRSGEIFPWGDEASVRGLGKLYYFQSVLENQERCLYGILKGLDTARSPVLNSRVGRIKLSQLEFVASQKIGRNEDSLRLRKKLTEQNSMSRSKESAQSADSEIKHESQFLNKFKSIKTIGRGGYGCVYEVETTLIGGVKWKCAVKRILLRQRDMREALKEVETLIALDHHGIVKFYDAWTEYPPPEIREYLMDSVFLYIQMELCQSTLSNWLAENDTRDLIRMIFWFKQIVCAVQYIHEMGRIHRDLKPNNILFSEPDRLKLCDLGIATDRAIVEGGEEVVKTRTCEKGTRMYMAPEQMGWVGYSSKVDIFALGLIFAEMCAVMTTDEAAEVFNNYRARKRNTILDHFPEAKRFVAWLTNFDDTKRPDCEEILKHPYICNGIPHPRTFLDCTLAIPPILRAQINQRKRNRDHIRHRKLFFNNRPKCCLQQPHSRNLSFPRK